MDLGEERMRGQLPVSLASIGMGGSPPVPSARRCVRSTVLSNTSISRRRHGDLRHTTRQNREIPLTRSREATLEKTSSGMLRGSSEDKASSPSSPTAASPIPFSSKHICNLDCYYGFVFEFIPFLSPSP
jgi:hypothetical protein